MKFKYSVSHPGPWGYTLYNTDVCVTLFIDDPITNLKSARPMFKYTIGVNGSDSYYGTVQRRYMPGIGSAVLTYNEHSYKGRTPAQKQKLHKLGRTILADALCNRMHGELNFRKLMGRNKIKGKTFVADTNTVF